MVASKKISKKWLVLPSSFTQMKICFLEKRKRTNYHLFMAFQFYGTGLVTGVSTPPLKIIWKFFIKLVLPRKQPLNLLVVFPLNIKKNFVKPRNFFWKLSNLFSKMAFSPFTHSTFVFISYFSRQFIEAWGIHNWIL